MTSFIPPDSGLGPVDYLELYKQVWNQDAVVAIDTFNKATQQKSATSDLLIVDWRDELSRLHSEVFLGYVGIKYPRGEFPTPINTLNTHRTGKQKRFVDYVLAQNVAESGLTILERRIALPSEGAVIGSFFRAVKDARNSGKISD